MRIVFLSACPGSGTDHIRYGGRAGIRAENVFDAVAAAFFRWITCGKSGSRI